MIRKKIVAYFARTKMMQRKSFTITTKEVFVVRICYQSNYTSIKHSSLFSRNLINIKEEFGNNDKRSQSYDFVTRAIRLDCKNWPST